MRTFLPIFIFIVSISSQGANPSSIAMEPFGSNSHFMVNVNIDDRKAEKFFVDTGATETVLFDWYVIEKNIKTSAVQEKGTDANGKKFSYSLAQINRLQLGDYSQKLESLPVVPSPGPIKQFRIAGILSPQRFFAPNPFLINFVENTLQSGEKMDLSRFELVTAVKIRPCSMEKPDKLVIPAKVGPIIGEFYLDTGAAGPTLKKKYVTNDLMKSGSQSNSFGISSKASNITVPNLPVSVGSLTSNLSVELTENDACENSHGRIGNSFWLKYALLFDSPRKNLTFYRPQ